MGKRLRRLHRFAQQVVQVTRRIARICVCCGTLTEEPRREVVPLSFVLSGTGPMRPSEVRPDNIPAGICCTCPWKINPTCNSNTSLPDGIDRALHTGSFIHFASSIESLPEVSVSNSSCGKELGAGVRNFRDTRKPTHISSSLKYFDGSHALTKQSYSTIPVACRAEDMPFKNCIHQVSETSLHSNANVGLKYLDSSMGSSKTPPSLNYDGDSTTCIVRQRIEEATACTSCDVLQAAGLSNHSHDDSVGKPIHSAEHICLVMDESSNYNFDDNVPKDRKRSKHNSLVMDKSSKDTSDDKVPKPSHSSHHNSLVMDKTSNDSCDDNVPKPSHASHHNSLVMDKTSNHSCNDNFPKPSHSSHHNSLVMYKSSNHEAPDLRHSRNHIHQGHTQLYHTTAEPSCTSHHTSPISTVQSGKDVVTSEVSFFPDQASPGLNLHVSEESLGTNHDQNVLLRALSRASIDSDEIQVRSSLPTHTGFSLEKKNGSLNAVNIVDGTKEAKCDETTNYNPCLMRSPSQISQTDDHVASRFLVRKPYLGTSGFPHCSFCALRLAPQQRYEKYFRMNPVPECPDSLTTLEVAYRHACQPREEVTGAGADTSTSLKKKELTLTLPLSQADCPSATPQQDLRVEYAINKEWYRIYPTHWTVQQNITHNTTGVVDLAMLGEYNKQIALKTMDVTASKREAEIMIECQGPFVVQLCASLVQADKRYLCMTYYERRDLAHWLRRDKERKYIGRQESIWICGYVLAAIEFLHDLEILHLDITPGNIMIHNKGYPVLGDFGSARSLEELKEGPKGFVFTLAYASPEILASMKPTRMADLWSLACVFYQMMTSKTPYRPTPEAAVQLKQTLQHRPDVSTLRTDVRDFVTSQLRKNMAERFGYTSGAREVMGHEIFKDLEWAEVKYAHRHSTCRLLAVFTQIERDEREAKNKPEAKNKLKAQNKQGNFSPHPIAGKTKNNHNNNNNMHLRGRTFLDQQNLDLGNPINPSILSDKRADLRRKDGKNTETKWGDEWERKCGPVMYESS